MSQKNIKKRNAGFTIIEVLIVLAIAALILLIVFLAVPALQRNSRNTSIKNDVQNVLGGLSEFTGANNGSMPTAIAATTGVVNYTGGSGTNATSIQIQGSTTVTSQTTAYTGTPNPDSIVVDIGHKCNSTAVSPRAAAAYYVIETTSATVKQCVDS